MSNRFAAYRHEKAVVSVTDSYLQTDRGWNETSIAFLITRAETQPEKESKFYYPN